MTASELETIYRRYLTCLNAQEWRELGHFVHEEVVHNGRRLGLVGYRQMLKADFSDIPDIYFHAELLIVEPPRLASRLLFNCKPSAKFLGLDVSGKQVTFAEHVLYAFNDKKIVQVWSVIDKTAIEAQLAQ
jgi:predicted ester cyclase